MNDLSGLGLQRLFGNFTKTAGRHVWAGLLNLFTAAAVARGYGPAGNGLYAVALLLPALLATTLGMGMASANVYHVGSGQYGPHAVARTTLLLWIVLSLVGLACGACLIWFYGSSYFPGIPALALWTALACFPLLLFISFAGSVFQGLQDFSSYNISLSLQPTAALIAILMCIAVRAKTDVLVLAYLFGALVAAVAILFILLRKLRRIAEPTDDHYPIRIALAYGLKSGLGNIVALLNYRLNIFLVNFFMNPGAAGIHAVALQLGEKIWLLSQAVSTVLLPRLSEVSGDRRSAIAITMLASRITLAATAVCALILGATGYVLITLAFGKDFQAAYIPLLLLLPGIVAVASVRILSSEISARGKPEINLYMAASVGAINLVLALFLIPRFGIAGAATATSLAYLSNLVIRVKYFCGYPGTSARDLLILKRTDIFALRQLALKYICKA